MSYQISKEDGGTGRTTGRQEEVQRAPRHPQADRESESTADRRKTDHLHRRAGGNRALQQLYRSGEIQAALTVNQPNDPAEREVEQVAEQVMRGGVEGEGVRSEAEETVDVNRSPTGSGPRADAGAREAITSVTDSGGRPLSPSMQSFFEPRFGRDLGDVRVHTNEMADRAARSIEAEAFTHGTDVVFRRGAYDPTSDAGRRLLAHELTHVVQQRGSTRRTNSDSVTDRRVQRQSTGSQTNGRSDRDWAVQSPEETVVIDETRRFEAPFGAGFEMLASDDSFVECDFWALKRYTEQSNHWEWEFRFSIRDFRDDSFGNNQGFTNVSGRLRAQAVGGTPQFVGTGGITQQRGTVHNFGNLSIWAKAVPDGQNRQLQFGFDYQNARSDATSGGSLDLGPVSIGGSVSGPSAAGGSVFDQFHIATLTQQ